MINIIPAILPASYRAIELGVQAIAGATNTIQIDFVDGFVASNRTWMFNHKDEERFDAILREDEGLPLWSEMNYEFDLMIKDPLSQIEKFIALGPSKIIFHLEWLDQQQMVQYFESLPEIVRTTITFGIAINIDTDPERLAPYMPYINTIQCMGIARIGFQSQPFDERALDQIKKVKALYQDKIISVDGGVSTETIGLLAQAGATSFVVGSAIFQSQDPRGTIEALCNKASQ